MASRLAFSRDSSHLAAAGNERVRIWELSNGRYMEWPAEQGAIHAMAYHPKLDLLATAGNDVRFWQPDTRQLVLVIEKHSKPVRDVSFSQDGNLLVTASDDQTVVVLNLEQLTESLSNLGLSSALSAD
jgi:WD40 repeat protein